VIDLRVLQFERVLGLGGFSKILKAHRSLQDPSPSQQQPTTGLLSTQPGAVVIKRIMGKKGDPAPWDHFLAEKELLSRVESPFVVKLFGIGVEGGDEWEETNHHRLSEENQSYNLIEEYLAGGDLFDLMKAMKAKGMASQAGGLSEALVRLHAAEVALGLEAIHEKGFAWLDLKPENIVFDGTEGHLKLIDFGTAVRVGHPHFPKTTLEYMSPELVEESKGREKHSDLRPSDLWSFGVLLFEMLQGFSPFRGFSKEDIERKILKAEFNSEMIPNRDARNLIDGLLVKNPLQRSTLRQVREHPFFGGTDWTRMRKRLPLPFPSWARNFYVLLR